MNPDYITREETNFKLIKNNNTKYTLTNFLKQEYPYIIQAMKYEKYKIEYEDYEILHELIYNNKVIGIMSIVITTQIMSTLCINEVYILPEYRHKGIFHEALINLLSQPNMNIALNNPNRAIIDLLIKYKLAKKLENNLIISYIDFLVDKSRIYTNKHILPEYDYNITNNELVPTDFYDLNINSCIFFELNNLKENSKNKALIIKARLTDTKEERYYDLLRNVDTLYLDNLKERIFNITDNEINFLQDVQKNIEEYLSINNLLGTEEELTPIFLDKLKEYNLTEKDGFNIRLKVLKALKKNEIIPKSIIIRTLYLMDNYKEEIITDYNIKHANRLNECPICYNEINVNEEVCRNCGHNLKVSKNMENIIEEMTDKLLCYTLPYKYQLKTKKNSKKDKISTILREQLDYMDFNEDEVYNTQQNIAAYQFLKDIDDTFYFEVFNYDLMNYIRDGSAFEFAKNNELIEELKNYHLYIKLMEECYSEKILKKILEENNYSKNGQKDELIQRIERNINPIDIFGKKYVLTDKGSKFIINKDYLENYLENLSEFTFYEYIDFYNKNKDKSFNELNREFVEYMENIALITRNYYKYHDTIRHRINNINSNHEDFLVLFTVLFIIDINYWIQSKEHRKTNKPLSNTVLQEYPQIKELFFKYNLEDILDKAMNYIQIEELKSYDELTSFYLLKSLEYSDIDDINREIEYNVYKDEYLERYSF